MCKQSKFCGCTGPISHYLWNLKHTETWAWSMNLIVKLFTWLGV